VGSSPAGCGPSHSNRGPVALCTLGLGLLNPPSSRSVSTGYGWEGIKQGCATWLGARYVPEPLCHGSVYLGYYNKCSTFTCTFLRHGACSLQDVRQKSEKISEMKAVMWQAANMEDRADSAQDVIVQLQRENHAMRELLQLELLDSTYGPAGSETPKPPSSDAAIQTQSSPDGDPFCTGDFATIRPRPSRTPPTTETRSTDNDSRHSPFPQNTDSTEGFPKSQHSSISAENPADSPSGRLLANDVSSTPGVSGVDSAASDETGNVNSSESLETLVNPNELSTDDEYL